jgi:hypothetical protein
MHDDAGAPRLPRVVRRNTGVSVLLLAAAAGAMFALGDVLLEQRRRNEFA